MEIIYKTKKTYKLNKKEYYTKAIDSLKRRIAYHDKKMFNYEIKIIAFEAKLRKGDVKKIERSEKWPWCRKAIGCYKLKNGKNKFFDCTIDYAEKRSLNSKENVMLVVMNIFKCASEERIKIRQYFNEQKEKGVEKMFFLLNHTEINAADFKYID